MLRRETSHSYETKVGATKFIVESECPENCKVDMLDALVNIIKKDLENISKVSKKKCTDVIEFSEVLKSVSGDSETR